MSSTLGNFIISDNITLDVPRAGFQCIQIGNTIYAIGGRLSKDINTPVSSISHASIENGSIGNFEPSSDITLDVPRADFQCIQIGNNVYAIGGAENDTSLLSSISIAPIISNPCFLSTTEILVDIDTYKTAKDIKVGEYISFFNTTSRVTRVIKSKIEDYEKLGDNKIFKIPKDFFSHGLPDKDTYLSGYHRLIFPSKTGFLGVQVFKCVPETNIIKTEKELLDITGENKLYYYNIELENNGFALVANNMAIESYVKS